MTHRLMTTKGKVALDPFPDMSIKTSLSGTGAVKVTRIENKVSLVGLLVRFDTEDNRFRKGQIAYVRGNNYALPWAKEIHEFAGEKYILVPDAAIEAIYSEF